MIYCLSEYQYQYPKFLFAKSDNMKPAEYIKWRVKSHKQPRGKYHQIKIFRSVKRYFKSSKGGSISDALKEGGEEFRGLFL